MKISSNNIDIPNKGIVKLIIIKLQRDEMGQARV